MGELSRLIGMGENGACVGGCGNQSCAYMYIVH